jgi:hypothetical protein
LLLSCIERTTVEVIVILPMAVVVRL